MIDSKTSTAYKLGSYQAIAQMMRNDIRNLAEAKAAGDEFMADWAIRNLCSLADQLDSTEEKFKKEVDIA